jgi:ataxia telangiectasia mutated family protein
LPIEAHIIFAALLAYFKAVDRGSQSQRYIPSSPFCPLFPVAPPLTAARNPFDDKSYHSLYEALFRCALIEKEAYFDSKKSARSIATVAARLENCAEALRTAVRHGATKIKRKTAKAIIDHISQALPGPDGGYIAPLLTGYVKALGTFLDFPSNVENLAAVSSESWDTCVDFCVEALSRYLEMGDRDSGSMSRASPAPGTSGRSGSVAASQGSVHIGSQIALEFLTCLNLLVAAPNASVPRKADKISSVVLQILQSRQMKIGELQKVAFSTFNIVFQRIQADDVALAKRVVRDLIPLVSHWWQPRALSRDAMLNSVRDEMLKTIYGTHLYVESLLRESSDESFFRDVEDLLDSLWSDYSRREDRARLQLDDVSFTGMRLPTDHSSTAVFSLRPYNQAGEQNWALLENLAILEAAYSRYSQREHSQQQPDRDQPRKRRRVAGSSNRIHQKTKSLDPAVRLSALQLLPFLAKLKQPSLEDITEAMADLSKSVTAKQPTVASWAMIACSR